MKNLLKNIPNNLTKELFDTLVKNKHVQIERIISKGHTSPEEGWYDQDRNEFVLLLKGAARLEFEGGRVESMGVGDWLEILAGVKHRVVWTDELGETVWVAVHY
jgi:cupin 2 domain-containing protein